MTGIEDAEDDSALILNGEGNDHAIFETDDPETGPNVLAQMSPSEA
jgi:hypothetical protein